jgi:transaldolase
MLLQASHFAGLAPNMQVKLPVTTAGLRAIEEATRRGISVNATVNTTLSGAIAVAEAVERGLDARKAAGASTDDVHPACTLMVGRLDDWLKVVAERERCSLTPGTLDWAGVAVFKRAYGLFRERGYRTRLLAAAFRSHLHWSQLMGADAILTMTHAWQTRFNASAIEVTSRIELPVGEAIVSELSQLADFRRAYEPNGLSLDEIDRYGATVRTLRQFIAASQELVGAVRDFVLPDPDREVR